MVPEILGIAVPELLLAKAPSSYVSFKQHAESVRQQQLEKENFKLKQEKIKSSQVNSAAVAMDSDGTSINSSVLIDI